MNPSRKIPAYKEPWFWAVMGPLLVVIVVSVSMAVVAVRVADDRVEDDYYKEGRMINKRFAEEEAAIAMAVQGDLEFDFTTHEVFANLQSRKQPAELVLSFSHPSDSQQDLSLVLKRVGEGRYRADLPNLSEVRWYVIIGNNGEGKDSWRVSTEVDFKRSHTAHFSAHL